MSIAIIKYPAFSVLISGRVVKSTTRKSGKSRAEIFNVNIPLYEKQGTPVFDFSDSAKYRKAAKIAEKIAESKGGFGMNPFLWCSNSELAKIRAAIQTEKESE